MNRYSLPLCLLLALPLNAAAQITLDQADFPLQIGSNPFANFSTGNEDGSNTAAIEALIALSGPNQVYDMTGVVYEEELVGTIEVEAGATGPAAEAEPLDQASLTAIFPFVINDEEFSAEGTIYFYHLLTDEAAYELGSFFLGESDGQKIALLITNTPGGQLDAIFPYTFASTWNSAFTQTINFDGFEIASQIDESSEVDGWGTLIVPGVEEDVPALRVKVTTEITTNGITSTDVCYEMRSAAPVVASVCEGNAMFGNPPTADIARLGSVSTDVEVAAEVPGAALASAYPNPAKDAVNLAFSVPETGPVMLTIYDVLGRPVHTVVDGVRSLGRHVEAVDTRGLSPGIYIARLSVGAEHWTRRVVIVR